MPSSDSPSVERSDGAAEGNTDRPQSQTVQPQRQQGAMPNRACEECKRKKTRCDMNRPECSLCSRVGSLCVFPTSRKRPQSNQERRQSKRQVIGVGFRNEELTRLLELLDSGALRQERSRSCLTASTDSSALDVRASDEFQVSTEAAFPSPGAQNRGMSPDPHAFWDTTPSALWDIHESFSNINPPTILDLPEEGSMPLLLGEIGDFSSALEDLRSDTWPIKKDQPRTFRLSISSSMADHLIDTFFAKIHSFVPIFHRTQFYERYVHTYLPEGERYTALSIESALILNAMFALSARFSNAPIFEDTPIKDRGLVFAAKAQSIYQEATQASEAETPSLAYLQGCILLAQYQQVSGLSCRAWISTGYCVRLAYDLGLNSVDEDIYSSSDAESAQWSSVHDWVRREELRRAWWSVWELDTFASTLSCRPFTIDPRRMSVLLPASDENWFSETPIESRFLNAEPLSAWKSLRGSPNQDERAWFLVSNFLMALANEMAQRRTISVQSKRDMETSISCFALSLPPQFSLSSGLLRFDEEGYNKSNWVISTILMLQGARCFTALLRENNSADPTLVWPSAPRISTQDQTVPPNSHSNSNLDMNGSLSSQPEAYLQQCRPYANEILKAIRMWSPEYIALTSPFIACTLIGPAALNIAVAKEGVGRQSAIVNGEMIELILGRFAEYWELGSLLLDLAQAFTGVESSSTSSLKVKTKKVLGRFAILLPKVLLKLQARCTDVSERG